MSNQDYAKFLHIDLKLRRELKERLKHASIANIGIERAANKMKVNIHTARPGIIIGKKGTEVEKLKQWVSKQTNQDVTINIKEIKKPELEAQLIAEGICNQLERRISFRRAMKKAEENALRFGAKGIKIKISGRLNGAEIARSEEYLSGQMPLQTLRANIQYGFAEALTTYGIIGVKVWVNRG
jgi:small subunit ribosomal protein S3